MRIQPVHPVPVICPYCSGHACLTTGKEVYPRLPHLHKKNFYKCTPCNAYVGCHPGTVRPLGDPANAELRRWRSNAHNCFDRIWKNGIMTRKEAYAWLEQSMSLSEGEAHIGMFGVQECMQVVRISNEFMQMRVR